MPDLSSLAVVYSLPTNRSMKLGYVATDLDTKDSAEEVRDALTRKGYAPMLTAVSEGSIRSRIRAIHADCIFNLIEWTGIDLPLADTAFGEIERTGIPFTGATRKNYMTTTDKIPMKRLLDSAGVSTPRWQMFTSGKERIRSDFVYPVIVKLALEHCSIGLTYDAIVHTPKDLRERVNNRLSRFSQSVLAEEFIDGRELQVTNLETPSGIRMLPPAEIIYDADVPFLTYESRWDETHPDYDKSYVTLSSLTDVQMKHLEKLSETIFTTLHFHDYNRLDLRIKGDTVYILEANANPGLSDSDEYGMTISYKAAGMTFADFVDAIVVSCMRRFHRRKHP